MKNFILVIMFMLMSISYAGAATNVALNWTAPTTNSDGSPIIPTVDLTGYKVYYGNSSGVYSNSVDVGNVTSYTVLSLDDGTYYFSITAYDSGGIESTHSTECYRVIDSVGPNPPTGLSCNF